MNAADSWILGGNIAASQGCGKIPILFGCFSVLIAIEFWKTTFSKLSVVSDCLSIELGRRHQFVMPLLDDPIRWLGVDDVVTFGMGRAPSLADVARIRFQMDETELETHLKTRRDAGDRAV
ncbi:hypothetical protein [Acetobacter nitrogenifigens]